MHKYIRAFALGLGLLGSHAFAQSPARERSVLTVITPEATLTIDPESGKSIGANRPAIPGDLSPDGTRVAHVKTIGVGQSSTTELFVSTIDKAGALSNQKQITSGAGNAMQPQWMPDGKQIVYVRGEGKFQQVYITNADAENWSEKRVSAGGLRSFNPRIAPNGTIAYLTERGRDGKATLVDLIIVKDGKPNPIVQKTAITEFAWSPDSNKIAYSTHGDLVIVDVAGKSSTTRTYQSIDERLYAHHADALAWRPDGQAIAASIQFSGGIEIANGEKPEPMFGAHEVFIIPIDGDAKWFPIGGRPREIEWAKRNPR